MNSLCLASSPTSGRWRVFDQASSHPLLNNLFNKSRFLGLVGGLIFLVPIGAYGQDSSSVAESRLACAQGLGQQAVNRVRAMGIQMGLADLCVKALNWTATNGKLLDIYTGETGEEGARDLVSRITGRARASSIPFRASSSPMDMWNSGELTPSLAFDAGFTQGFLEKATAPSASIDMTELKRRTEGCLNLNQSLAACAEAGRIQGAMANQVSNAFSDTSTTPAPKSGSQGPDRAQTEAAIDQKFQNWAQSWSMDRYNPGSARVTNIDCSEQCKASGQFSFTRFGALHTIAFVAFIQSESDGKYSLGRLCYDDNTSNMRDCTE